MSDWSHLRRVRQQTALSNRHGLLGWDKGQVIAANGAAKCLRGVASTTGKTTLPQVGDVSPGRLAGHGNPDHGTVIGQLYVVHCSVSETINRPPASSIKPKRAVRETHLRRTVRQQPPASSIKPKRLCRPGNTSEADNAPTTPF